MLTKYETVGSFVAPAPSTTSLHNNMGNVHSRPAAPSRSLRHIFIITGPAGCGKSSVAFFLARRLNLPYIEGDDFHPRSNIEKMANGIPLTDDDRWDWLETIRKQAVLELESDAEGCVVTCSCLKRKYRDVIRLASREADDVVVRFVYLRADKELLLCRVRARKGHYMKDDMVASQFEALEEPDETELDVIPIDVSGTLDSVQSTTIDEIHRVLEGKA